MSSGLEYRRDVDGLRAIAVLLVVGFHALPKYIPGGYVGVDVFFVISGFLISGIIFDELARGSFSFATFYARRARRIFPALILVLIASLIAGWFFLLPDDFRSLGKHIAASATFATNLSLYFDVGYFDGPAEQKPLLHLWSLGIEEQFYAIWPIIVVLCWRWPRALALMIGAVLIVSFTSNIYLTSENQQAAFYLPHARFWELMIGCGLALASRRGFLRIAPVVAETIAWLGIVLIALAVVLLRPASAFPGWWALLPTLGAAALIVAGPTTRFNRLVLSHPAAVWVGLISYPLYLWHWPLLAFARAAHYREPNLLTKAALVAVAFVLAWLTYRFIEKPIRQGGSLRLKAVAATAVLILIGGIGLLTHTRDGFVGRYPGYLQDAFRQLAADPNISPCMVSMKDGARAGRELCAGDGENNIVLWGDSHAGHLAAALRASAGRDDLKITEFTAAGCPPVAGFQTSENRQCAAANETALASIHKMNPQKIIVAANWLMSAYRHSVAPQPRVDEQIVKSMRDLQARGAKIVMIGQFPIWRGNVPKIALQKSRGPKPSRDLRFLQPNFRPLDQHMRELAAQIGIDFISPADTLCDAQGCLLLVPGQSRFTTRDLSHLTRDGADFFITANAAKLLGR